MTYLSTLVWGCLLLSQAPAAPPFPASDRAGADSTLPKVPATATPEVNSPGAGVTQPEAKGAAAAEEPITTAPSEPARRSHSTPPEMVAEAMVSRPGSKLSGQPLSLLAALSSTGDRRQQLEVTHAYWRLVEALAVYHFCLDHDAQLKQFQTTAEGAAQLQTARASAAALLAEAEAAAVAAQHELAALVLLPPEAPLPLPADRPHVGQYVTHFSELFSARSGPPRARLIDRLLPLRCRAIEGRGQAVQAADDTLAATLDAYKLGRDKLSGVLESMGQHLRQRQAFMALVCQYNRDIADYALGIAGPQLNGRALVGMLIKPAPGSGHFPTPAIDRGVQPAGLNEPVPTPAPRLNGNRPTPAPRRERPEGTDSAREPEPFGKNQPTPAPPPQAAGPAEQNEPAPALPPAEAKPTGDALPKRPMVPVKPPAEEPLSHTLNKPAAAESISPEAPSSATAALYPALAAAAPAVRAKQLAVALHWDRSLPEGAGEPISLADCLRSRPAANRQELIDAYWVARQRAAEYQVLAQQSEMFDGLSPSRQGDQPLAERRLRAAKLAAAAARDDVHAALLEAQFELAARIGRDPSSAWPMPSTVPHSGPYLLKLEAQPRHLAQSWPLRRLAAIMPRLAEGVRQRAAAVVEADAARAAAMAGYQAQSQALEPVLAAVQRQAELSLGFLQALTDYNRTIAQYALAVLPAETPGDKLVRALVVQP